MGPKRMRNYVAWSAVVIGALAVFISFSGIAAAKVDAEPGIAVDVRLSGGAGDGAALSVEVGLTPAEPGTRYLPAPRDLRLRGDLGAIDLRGVPTCRPSARSFKSSGCTAPAIGAGRGYAYESFGPEGSGPLKVYGRFRLYSGGQHDNVARIYAWASFPDAGPHEEGRVFVVPVTSTRTGVGRSELLLRLPHPEVVPVFSLADLSLSFRRRIALRGRSIQPVEVRCRPRQTGMVLARADFYDYLPVPPVESSTIPGCSR